MSAAEALASCEYLVYRIRLCFGTSREVFETQVLPLLQRYAAYVHLLPATPDGHHASPGGLLSLGLEVAFYSLQGTDAHIFSGRSTISVRRHLEPRWRLGTFIGGLCSELHRTMSHLTATDRSGAVWPACMTPLADWIQAHAVASYIVRWQRHLACESRGLGLFALPMIVGPGILQYLGEDNAIIVPHLLASISGVPLYGQHNVLDDLVRRASALVIDRDLQMRADSDGSPRFGPHLVRHLIDSMRRLLAESPSWKPNRDKSRVWLGRDGLFLVWPQAIGEVQHLLEIDELAGIPRSPETLLGLLLDAGVVVAQENGLRTWAIAPPDSKVSIDAVKVCVPSLLLADAHVEPLTIALAQATERTEPLPSASVRAPTAATTSSGTQLSLIDPVQPSRPVASTPAPPDPGPALTPAATIEATEATRTPLPQKEATAPLPPRQLTFRAPMRLNPAVSAALSDIVAALNGPSETTAVVLPDGLFVPLRELQSRGIPAPTALRALKDAHLLRHPPTRSVEIKGQSVLGVVLPQSSVGGLQPEAEPSTGA